MHVFHLSVRNARLNETALIFFQFGGAAPARRGAVRCRCGAARRGTAAIMNYLKLICSFEFPIAKLLDVAAPPRHEVST